MRWLVGVLVLAVVIAGGGLFFLHPDPVLVHLAPGRQMRLPLGTALLSAFAMGAGLIGLVVGLRAGALGWRRWRARRHAQRATRQGASTARARELVWAGDYAQARAELLRSEKGTPADAGRVALLAETYLQENDLAAARTLLDDALGRLGTDARLLDLLAETAERQGDLHAAADALARARQALPGSPRLVRRLRDVHAAAGRWSEALGLQGEILLGLRDATTLAQEEGLLRGLRYQVALADDDPRRAARRLLALAREAPGFVPAWVSGGDKLAAAGRRFAARRAWERGARHQPAVVLLERLAHLNADDHKPERTTRILRRLQRRHPDAPAIPLVLARQLIGQGALDAAGEVLATVPAPAAGHPLVHMLWGELHRRQGNHTQAADTFARALGDDLGVVAPFRCTACGRAGAAWEALCPGCRRWGTAEARGERAADAD